MKTYDCQQGSVEENPDGLGEFVRLADIAWQPIETAPKDGTEILAWDGDDRKILRWALGRWDDWDEMPSALGKPTHWMPLPEPPK